jgi:mRNA interferase MazF
VVSPRHYLESVTTLVAVLPVTSTDRGWPNHVRLGGPHGLDRPSSAMAEQVRTIDRGRITGVSGIVDGETLGGVRRLLRLHLDR